MSIFTVGDSLQLANAIKLAAGGDTILLSEGTYSGLSFKNLHFSQPVTITSETGGAVLKSFNISNSNGLSFQNLEFSNAGETGYYTWGVTDSQDIHFNNIDIHGSLNGNPQDDVEGIGISHSSNVSITNSQFHELYRSIAVGSDDGVRISGNSFHDIARSGIYGADSSNVVISHNSFTDFFPRIGDHMDAIAFYNTAAGGISHNITISDNIIVKGAGSPTQGIYLRGPSGSTATSYDNLSVTNNLVVGEGYNGIGVGEATHLNVSGNVVVSYPGKDRISWIDIRDTVGAVVSNNQAALVGVVAANNNIGLIQSGNVITSPVTDLGAVAIGNWLSLHPDDWSHIPSSVQALAFPTPTPAPVTVIEPIVTFTEFSLGSFGGFGFFL